MVWTEKYVCMLNDYILNVYVQFCMGVSVAACEYVMFSSIICSGTISYYSKVIQYGNGSNRTEKQSVNCIWNPEEIIICSGTISCYSYTIW